MKRSRIEETRRAGVTLPSRWLRERKAVAEGSVLEEIPGCRGERRLRTHPEYTRLTCTRARENIHQDRRGAARREHDTQLLISALPCPRAQDTLSWQATPGQPVGFDRGFKRVRIYAGERDERQRRTLGGYGDDAPLDRITLYRTTSRFCGRQS